MVAHSVLAPARNAMVALAEYLETRSSTEAEHSSAARRFTTAWPHEFVHSVLSDFGSTSMAASAADDKRAVMQHNIVLVFVAIFIMVLDIYLAIVHYFHACWLMNGIPPD